jgi:hypothetical protein
MDDRASSLDQTAWAIDDRSLFTARHPHRFDGLDAERLDDEDCAPREY